jgi:3-oxoadipate enol-lactonase
MLKARVNGINLAYDRLGRGTTLMLVHGYPLDRTIWNQVVPLLKDDFDLVVPDLRGFGESGLPPTPYQLTDMAADLASLLDLLKIKKIALAGHSMGGYIALAFASVYPDRLLGLGLVASQALADSPERKAARYQEAEDVLAHGVEQVAAGMSLKLTDDPRIQAQLKELILGQRPQGLAGGLRAMAERSDSMKLLADLNIPVALIHGILDKLIPVERARAIREVLKKGHLTEIGKVGHMPMLDAPQVTAEALKTLI